MRSIFFFDTMLTPRLITFLYWFLLCVAAIFGFAIMFRGGQGFSIDSILGAAITTAGLAVSARIGCELLIVLFKVYENIKKLADSAN